jgi:hypothetical protein
MDSEGCAPLWDNNPVIKPAKISRMPKCVLERSCECARTSDHHLPISSVDTMNAENEIVCGADIDKMIKTISLAGYLVEKDLKEGCGRSSHPVFFDVFHVKRGMVAFAGASLAG